MNKKIQEWMLTSHSVLQFRKLWRNYLLQSLLATVSLFGVLLVVDSEHSLVIASIAGTAFIVFAMPKTPSAAPRRVIGGQVIGLLCGAAWSAMPHDTWLTANAIFALAAGSSFLLMVITNTEHPPASATALGIVETGCTVEITVALLVCVLTLSLLHILLKSHLKSLV